MEFRAETNAHLDRASPGLMKTPDGSKGGDGLTEATSKAIGGVVAWRAATVITTMRTKASLRSVICFPNPDRWTTA